VIPHKDMPVKFLKLAEIHLAVFLFGVAAIFGKLLDLHPLLIVLGRVLFSSVFLAIIVLVRREKIRVPGGNLLSVFVLLGVLLAFHWWSFFQSIRLSSVAVGLLSFSTFPLFVSFLSPRFSHERFRPMDLLIALLALAGVGIAVMGTGTSAVPLQGALWGLGSGFAYALLTIFNKRLGMTNSSISIALFEQVFAAVLLLPVLLFIPFRVDARDIGLLFLLGTVFTGLSHLLFIRGLAGVRAQTASVISTLEPLYGIIFAVLLLGEIPSVREIAGGALIVSMALWSSLREKACPPDAPEVR